jgi:hypothetical protein
MGRYRTITKEVEVDVDIYVSDLMEELEDDELIDELKRRKCDMRFMDFSFPELDDNEFRKRMAETIYQIDTQRAKIVLEALMDSYHYSFIKDTLCDQ